MECRFCIFFHYTHSWFSGQSLSTLFMIYSNSIGVYLSCIKFSECYTTRQTCVSILTVSIDIKRIVFNSPQNCSAMDIKDLSELSYETFKSKFDQETRKVLRSTLVSQDGGIIAEGKQLQENAGGKRRIIPLPAPYSCKECGTEYHTIQKLRIHFLKHLSGTAIICEDGSSSYPCRHFGCEKNFMSRVTRRSHEAEHVQGVSCERYVIKNIHCIPSSICK